MWGFDFLFAMPRAPRSRWVALTSNVNHLMSTSHVHIIYLISTSRIAHQIKQASLAISHVNILFQHQTPPNKASIHLYRHHMSTSLLGLSGLFFLHIIYYTFHFIIANLSMVGLLPSVAAVEFLLKIAEQNNDLRKGVLPCETSRRGVPSS